MLVPVGALLWRDAKRPLAWSGGILALALALEIVQVAFRLYYLRLYAVLACAAGLAVGAGFDAALRWAQGRSARGWALLCACACIAIGAEFVRTGGVPIYTAATGIGPVNISGYYWPLVVGVGLGKAVCLGMAARSLLRPWPAAALCTALLCLAWPAVFWEASSQGLEDPWGDRAVCRVRGRRVGAAVRRRPRGRGVPAAGPGGVKRAHVFEIGKIMGKEREEEKWKKR